MEKRIEGFDGEFSFLSNFFEVSVIIDGIRYTNSEAAFQSQKCALLTDRLQFVNLIPGKAKRLGRKVTLRPDWEQIKDEVMYQVCKSKFSQNPTLRDLLVATGDAYIEETNHWNDTYWGVSNSVGQNKLGHILMRLRYEFASGLIK